MINVWRYWRDEFYPSGVNQHLVLWLGFSLILGLAYPGRQVWDMGWSLIPLWGLAAIILAEQLNIYPENKWIIFGQTIIIFLIYVLFWLQLAGISQFVAIITTDYIRLGLLVGILLLSACTVILVSLGWSWEVAKQGMVLGTTIALSIYTLSNMWSVSQLYPGREGRLRQELWNSLVVTEDTDLFLTTLRDLSLWETGRQDGIEAISMVDLPSLRWVLRDFPKARLRIRYNHCHISRVRG